MQIRLLGDFKISDADKLVSGLTRPRMQSLLAYLLLHGDAPQSRSHLAYTFWPDSSESQARTNLRRELLQLRRVLPHSEQYLRIETQTIQWNPEADYALDVADFNVALTEAKTSTETGKRTELLQTAVDIYRGDLLPGVYEEWVLAIREKLAQQYVQTLEQLITLHTDQRNFTLAVDAAQRLLRYDPLYEAGYYRLMELYAYQNERARALHTYHSYATLLERELGVAPGAEIQSLYEQLVQVETTGEVQHSSKTTESMQLVGRTREWKTLLSTWRRASRGRSQFVLIEGEAGIGKTRLGEELLEWVNRQGVLTTRTRSYAAEGSLAYAPIIEWLRSEDMQALLVNLDFAWQTEIARLLPELLRANPELPHPESLTENWQRQRLFEALAHAFTADAQPKLLMIDDLQWCDQETLEWLRYLLRFDPTAPLLVLGTARPEEIRAVHPLRALLNELSGGEQLTTIQLPPLTLAETGSLATLVCGKMLNDQEATQLYAASEGYPLFVVEMVRAGYNERKSDDEAEAAMTTPDAQLPPKVVTVIQSRLAQLSPTARKLAGLAATVGRSFDFEVLVAASDDDEDTVANGLDELWRRRIIREKGSSAYDFSHDRIRDVAYAEIGPVKRRWFHHQIAATLHQLHSEDLDPVSAQLATHYERAGHDDEAIGWRLRAAQVSLTLHAPVESIIHIRAGLALLEQKPINRARQEMELQLLLLLGQAYRVAYGFTSPEYEEVLLRTQAVAEIVADLDILADIFVFQTEMSIARGRNQAARTLVNQALATLRADANSLTAMHVHREDARVATHMGNFAHARRSMEQAFFAPMPFHEKHERSSSWKQFVLIHLCVLQWLTGNPDLAADSARRGLDEARQHDSPTDFTNILFSLAIYYRNVGDLVAVKANADQMVSIGAKYDLPLSQQSGDIFSGWVLAHQGDILAGIQQTTHGIDGFRRMGHSMFQTHRLAMLAEMHLMAGQLDEAQTVLDEAFSISQEKDERFWDVELHRLQGDLLLAQGAESKAEDAYHQAIEVARQQQTKSLELRAMIALCRLWQRQGKRAQARQRLSELYSWFSEGFDTHDLQSAKELLDQLS